MPPRLGCGGVAQSLPVDQYSERLTGIRSARIHPGTTVFADADDGTVLGAVEQGSKVVAAQFDGVVVLAQDSVIRELSVLDQGTGHLTSRIRRSHRARGESQRHDAGDVA